MTLTTLLLLPHLWTAPAPWPVFFRHDRDPSAALELGRRFDATVRCGPGDSGTLVAERWVLTAAHVAHGLSPFTPLVTVGGVDYPVVRRVFHPDSVDEEHPARAIDLALLQLGRPVEDLRPAPLYRATDEVGQAVFVVGFGDFGAANGEIRPFDGQRRAVTNRVERIELGHLLIDFDAPGDGATELEGIGAPGDSGGSLYVETEAGPALAGVSFAGLDDPPNGYGGRDLYVRVSSVAKWVDATIAANLEAPLPRPDWIDVSHGFPSDGAGELLSEFFAAVDQGGAQAARFAEQRRSAGARRGAPNAEFVERLTQLRGELGPLRPDLLAPLEGGEYAVRVAAGEEWHAFYFLLSEGPRLEDFDFRPEPTPN
ncbi:S1 family peptidase [Engelhardtia mirabilis]|uniref:Trypsin n=1 Tax=Engelhardtia mirabilis TaxID=2528011 RepID=A0A518BS23_9BACT|nr:Trypsin [Planctomycetes bacterium Pla133]QDV04086.1 Trypsin [Planctomycetes bacterium Pla86]